MSKFAGRQMSVGIAREAVRGTALDAEFWIPWAELELEENVTKVLDNSSLGVIEDSDANDNVKKMTEFTLSTKVKDDHIALILFSLFGSLSSLVKETTAFNHTITVAQTNLHQSLTLSEFSPNEDVQYPNCVIDSIEFTAVLGDYVRYTATGRGLLQEAATNTVAHVQEYDFKPQDVVFKNATNQAGLDAAPAVNIREFTLSISQNPFDEDVLGSITPVDFLNQQFTVEGTVTLIHDDATYQDLQLADTVQALRFDMIGSETIGAISNPEVKIDLDKVSIFDYTRDRSLDGIVLETFSFKAHYDLSNANMITIIVTNEVVSY